MSNKYPFDARPDFDKSPDGLLPVIVQDARTRIVLMQGYFNAEALDATLATGKITFFSRSKQRLWVKGETSGHFLHLVSIALDCDQDSFLAQVRPEGPVCHTGADTCWAASNKNGFLYALEQTIAQRKAAADTEHSYTAQLFAKGIPKIAQKVGEEAVETVIEALGHDRDRLLNESADLLYHLIVLLAAKDVTLADVEATLEKRMTNDK